MTERKRSFVGGAAILAVAGLIGKVIAAFYRIGLNVLIGSGGMAVYNVPYSYYSLLLVISTAGIPTAISKLVSERLSQGDERGAKEVFHAALRVLLVTGTVTTLAMALLAKPLATAAAVPEAASGFIALAPSLLIVCLLSAYRGYFQGRQNMVPSAVSQIVEQIGRLVFGYGLAYLWADQGIVAGATGAVLGITLCELASLVMILGSYTRHTRTVRVKVGKVNFRPIAKSIFRIAIPVTLGACIMPIVNLTDTMTVINRLTDAGMVKQMADSLYGILTGIVQSVINMPAVLTLSLSVSLVPAISNALTRKSGRTAADTARLGIKLALLIGLPCVAGLHLLAEPIIMLLSPAYSAWEIQNATMILKWLSFAVLFLSISQTTTGILQGYGKAHLPVISLAVGGVVKIVLNYVLIGIPQVGIMGAVIGSVSCYAIASMINLRNVVHQSGMRFDGVQLVVKPLLATLSMGAVVAVGWHFLPAYLGRTVSLGVCVLLGVLVYAALLLVFGALSREELNWIPGGGKLARLLEKMHIKF